MEPRFLTLSQDLEKTVLDVANGRMDKRALTEFFRQYSVNGDSPKGG